MNGPHRDDENVIAAFAQDEIFLVSIALFGAVAITIWKAIQ